MWAGRALLVLNYPVRFLEVVSSAEQFDVLWCDARAAFAVRNIVVKVEIVRGAALDAAALVSLPDNDLYCGWDLTGGGEFPLIFGGCRVRGVGRAEVEAEDVSGAWAGGDRFDLGVDQEMTAAIAPDAAGDLLVDLDDLGVLLAVSGGDGGVVELAVLGEAAAGMVHGLVEVFGVVG